MDELQIELQPGSYIPLFRMATALVEPLPVSPAKAPEVGRSAGRRLLGSIVVVPVLLAVGLLIRSAFGRTDPVQSFWGPVLSSPRDVLLCVGDLERGRVRGSGASPIDLRPLSMGDFHRFPSQTIHVSDAVPLANFVGFLGRRNKRWWRVADQTAATYSDLRNGPAILIGLMNNDWTEHVVWKVRFKAEKLAPRRVVIRDGRNPTNESWSMDYSTPLLEVKRDYALVLRVFDPNTIQTVITAAGISVFGTLAASEFLTDARSLSELSEVAPGWEASHPGRAGLVSELLKLIRFAISAQIANFKRSANDPLVIAQSTKPSD